MKIQQPSRKEQVRKVLEAEGKALSIDTLEQLTKIPKEKIRQVLTTFENQIVRVGPKTFDLSKRVHPGKTLRYTPEKIEIEHEILKAEEDIYLFLTADMDFGASITLIDHQHKQYHLSRIVTSKKYPFFYYRGIHAWYKHAHFEVGDDILLTCKDLGSHTFHIDRQKKKDRDEFGRFGFCVRCEERVIWEDEGGWRNIKNDAEYVDCCLPSTFFKLEKEYRIID